MKLMKVWPVGVQVHAMVAVDNREVKVVIKNEALHALKSVGALPAELDQQWCLIDIAIDIADSEIKILSREFTIGEALAAAERNSRKPQRQRGERSFRTF